jgi:hypothetical protein
MQILCQSLPKPGKARNGDSYETYEDETIWIGCIADGAGNCPCDWKAAAQVCQDFIGNYVHGYPALGLQARLVHSLKATFAKLYDTPGECAGMRSTLAALVIDKAAGQYYTLSVGDSKVLEIREAETMEWSKETDFELGPAQLQDCLAGPGKLGQQLGFALMTDGFWGNRKGYEPELAYLFGSGKAAAYFDQLISLNQHTQDDDMTLMMVVFANEQI